MAGTLVNLLIIILAIVLFLAVWNSYGPVALLINTIIALIALKVVGWLGVHIEISIWSILILLIAGIPGLLVLMFLSITGIAFRGK